MKKLSTFLATLPLLGSTLAAQQIGNYGEVTGQIRSVYAGYNQKQATEPNTYATALGGMLKYESPTLSGLSVGFAVTGSQDLDFASGKQSKLQHNAELSSPKESYVALSEAYINYTLENLNIRLGRQIVDTPLADSDDIRMIPNTFEAYIATYSLNNFDLTLGHLQRWQGADAGLGYDGTVELRSKWADTEGATMFGISHDNDESPYKLNAWYYDVEQKSDANKATYLELGYQFSGNVGVLVLGQYLSESEQEASNTKANICGALVELEYDKLSASLAYNRSEKHAGKKSFSGFGGGTLFTSMDTMILDEITEDREAYATVFGLGYSPLDSLSLSYAYGDFKGKANSAATSEHITEQDIALEYAFSDEFNLAAIYVISRDKENSAKTAYDWDRAQVMLTYDF